MQIQFLNGRIYTIDGATSFNMEAMHQAARELLTAPCMEPEFTGNYDTESKLFTETTYDVNRVDMIGVTWVPFSEYDDLAKAFAALGDDLKAATEALAKMAEDLATANQSIAARQEEIERWRGYMADVLDNVTDIPAGTIDPNKARDAVIELKTRLYFADDFKAQVCNLIGMDSGDALDSIYHVIQAMAIKFNHTDPVELELTREPVAVVHKVGEVTKTEVFEHPADPVGKAVFECTFEWARDNWDLFVDTFIHKTIHNPTETGGYIKVVTTS
jgi:hypothetical protein